MVSEEYAIYDLSFLSFIMFIATIATMVQLVEIIVEKFRHHYTIHLVYFYHLSL